MKNIQIIKLDKKKNLNYDQNPFKVKSVDGYAMLIKFKKLNKLKFEKILIFLMKIFFVF